MLRILNNRYLRAPAYRMARPGAGAPGGQRTDPRQPPLEGRTRLPLMIPRCLHGERNVSWGNPEGLSGETHPEWAKDGSGLSHQRPNSPVSLFSFTKVTVSVLVGGAQGAAGLEGLGGGRVVRGGSISPHQRKSHATEITQGPTPPLAKLYWGDCLFAFGLKTYPLPWDRGRLARDRRSGRFC